MFMSRSFRDTRLLNLASAVGALRRPKERRSQARRFHGLECLEQRALLANITASAVISSASQGSNTAYTLTLTNSSSSTSGIGTFWYAWVPGKDFLAQSPLAVTPPTGWSDQITHAGTGDGYAIQYTADSSIYYVQPGNSLNFGFTSAEPPSSVEGNSQFYPTTPASTSVVYPQAPFSDSGHEFVTTPAPTSTPAPTPTPTPTSAPTITGDQIALISLKHNKRGKPIGQPVVTFAFSFSTAMDVASVDDMSNYQVDWTSTKRVRKQIQTVSHQVAVKSVTYNAATNSVMLVTSATKMTFAKGGQVTIIGSAPGGVESASGVFPAAGSFTFTVSPSAKGITP
jgi:hypothetical protein